MKRWGITLTATALSTCALDAVATAVGILLAASHLLAGVDHALLLVFLAGTYLLWSVGLWANLKANWTLLEETGTSTNALSKAAYDVTRLRTGSVRVRRLASAFGYAGVELAKEVPYYAGALGAAFFSDSVSSNDALIFLGGTNLGAAAYEYGLARTTWTFVHRKRAPPPAPPSRRSGYQRNNWSSTTLAPRSGNSVNGHQRSSPGRPGNAGRLVGF